MQETSLNNHVTTQKSKALFCDAIAAFPISRQSLHNFTERFYRIYATSSQPRFAPLNIVFNKFSYQDGNPVQQEMFDNIRQNKPNRQREAETLSDILKYFATAEPCPSVPFLAACHNWILDVTSSFGRKDIALLQPVLAKEYFHPRVSETYAAVNKEISAKYNQAFENEISGLNNWAFRYQSKGLLNNLAFRSAYINLLYERLVCDRSIKEIYPWQYNKRQKQHFKDQVTLTTGLEDERTGKIICYPHALNKVYKFISNRDNFKLDACRNALPRFAENSFYADCRTILAAIDGGPKNRNVQIPQQRPQLTFDKY